MTTCEKGEQWEEALRLLQEMPHMSLMPDVVSYSAAMSACEKRRACLGGSPSTAARDASQVVHARCGELQRSHERMREKASLFGRKPFDCCKRCPTGR